MSTITLNDVLDCIVRGDEDDFCKKYPRFGGGLGPDFGFANSVAKGSRRDVRARLLASLINATSPDEFVEILADAEAIAAELRQAVTR